jgi:CHAT domain-containing protein
VQAFESVLYLAQDKLPKDPLPKPDEPFINGELSAREVMQFWKLDADLVTLSACESALGRSGGGDGLLGFAQAFLQAGSRSVCLSLWKVDDTATALLMDRFYRNLAGKRDGLDKPMPKAEALAEAKNWLRNLSIDEVSKHTALLTNGVARGKDQPALNIKTPERPASEPKDGFKPFAHPKYWAAFILIGDPN